jgi:hypothetical protein
MHMFANVIAEPSSKDVPVFWSIRIGNTHIDSTAKPTFWVHMSTVHRMLYCSAVTI